MNINCPGLRPKGHQQPHLGPAGRFGDQRVRAAAPWVNLPRGLRQRLAFFHHKTQSAAHTEHDETMTLRGAVKNAEGNGREMLPSMICQLSADRFEYKQPEPFVLCPQRISFESQPIQRATPTGLKALFTGQQDALNDLRPLRDRTLDQLYSHMRERGTRSQTSFLDRFLNGRDQARRMGNDLGQLLEAIPANPESSNGARDQIIAAVALAQLNACPVIVISIPFGRDNHQDSDLSIEAEQTTSGVANIGFLWEQLRATGQQDQVSFALLNVFGRKVRPNGRGGRDHNKEHGVMVAFGPHVNGGVYGGLKSNGQCKNIRPNNGRGANSGGIGPDATLATAGKSLTAALGHADGAIEDRIHSGRILRPFIRRG